MSRVRIVPYRRLLELLETDPEVRAIFCVRSRDSLDEVAAGVMDPTGDPKTLQRMFLEGRIRAVTTDDDQGGLRDLVLDRRSIPLETPCRVIRRKKTHIFQPIGLDLEFEEAKAPSRRATEDSRKKTAGKRPATNCRRICGVVNFEGRAVPVDRDGYYLDWRRIRGAYAEVLTSPYGPNHFVLGIEKIRITLDFARLPADYFFLTARCEPSEIDLHPEDRAIVRRKSEVVESAFYLVSHAVEALDRLGVACNDPWDFVRKLCLAVESDGDATPGTSTT